MCYSSRATTLSNPLKYANLNLRRGIWPSDWVYHAQVIVDGIAAGIWAAYQKHRQRTNVHIMALNLVRGVTLTPREKKTMLDILTTPPPPRKWWWPGKWCRIHVLDLVAAHKWSGCKWQFGCILHTWDREFMTCSLTKCFCMICNETEVLIFCHEGIILDIAGTNFYTLLEHIFYAIFDAFI
jgi:hypothetical protein